MSLKSKKEDLEKRGFVSDFDNEKFSKKTEIELLEMLKSKLATERTVAAKFLAENQFSQSISQLCLALEKEKKLYSKMEICNSLVAFGEKSVSHLIEILGKIGNNQYKEIPQDEFKKKNYPLPRDISARTLMRIGKVALPQLFNLLKSDEKTKINEAIDAIGYICYYEKEHEYFNILKEFYQKNRNDELLVWKIMRAMSAFPQSRDFLISEKKLILNPRIKKEIERSLGLRPI